MEGSYSRVKDLQEDEHDRTMVHSQDKVKWLTTAAEMIEAVKRSELTPYKCLAAGQPAQSPTLVCTMLSSVVR